MMAMVMMVRFIVLPIGCGGNARGSSAGPFASLAKLAALLEMLGRALGHAWLMPAYIAYYTLARKWPADASTATRWGGLTFIMLLVFAVPVGMHHLFADPEVGAALNSFKAFSSK